MYRLAKLLHAIAPAILLLSPTSPLAANDDATVAVGVAKVDATPPFPVILAGYGGRTKEHEGVDARLWARAMVIGTDKPVAIVVLDNCGVPASVRARLAERLQSHGIDEARLVVAATHTHNAPTLVDYATVVWAGRTTKEQEKHVKEYTALAVERMEAAVLAALRARVPLRLEWAQGRITFGGNRRVLNLGKWSGFGFQRNKPVDHSLPVLAARDAEGTVRAVWANYACHCTTVGGRNRIGGDWAGYANEAMEKRFPKAVALMTIGCGADVGPQPSGSLEIAREHGEAIGAEVQRLLTAKTTALASAPRVTHTRVKLPLAAPTTREHWEKEAKRGGFYSQQAKIQLRILKEKGAIPTTVDYPMAVWTFGKELTMIFLAGEVVVDYSVRLNRELDWSRLWITGWSNAMPGYIPSRRVLNEGGYEADFSQVYYALPGRYAPQVEDIVVGGIRKLVDKSFLAATGQPTAPFHQAPSAEAETFRRFAKRLQEETPQAEREVIDLVRKRIPAALPAMGRLQTNQGKLTDWYNFAGDSAERLFIRQTRRGTLLSWHTPTHDAASQGDFTVCFTGGIGWISEPKTEGFVLEVDGRPKIRFDVTRDPARWTSADGDMELLYLPTWTSNVDSAGFFFLHLPRQTKDKKSMLLGVRSLGAGSKRWFAIDTKQDLAARLKRLSDVLNAKQ